MERAVTRLRLLIGTFAALAVAVLLTNSAASDVAAPTIASSVPASPGNSTTPTLNGTAVPGATVNIYTDDGCAQAAVATTTADAQTGAFSVQVSAATDTTPTFYATATDATPETSPCSAGFAYQEDSTPPPVPDIGPHASLEATSSTTFTFSSAGASSFECQVDGAAFSPCSSGDSFGPFGDGLHTFFVRALDDLSNASEAAQAQWTVDTTAPTGSLDINNGATFTGSTAVKLNLQASDGAGSGIAGYRVADGNDCSSASFVTVSPVSPYSADIDYTLPSGDGPKTVCVEYEDAAGNLSSTSSAVITLDTQNPIVKVDSGPHDPSNQTSATFTFSSSKSPSTFRCRLDGGAFTSCTSPKAYPGPLGDGQHTFSVRATHLGNEGPTTDYAWTVDTIPPETTIASTPPPSSSSATAAFSFTSSEAGSTFACSLDASGFTPCASPQTYSGLGDGTHTFSVQAIDAAGNADATPPSYSWQIVGVGPNTTDRTPPGNVKGLTRNVRYG